MGISKQYLGESNYKELEAYEKTVPERMALSMFKEQLGTGAGALTPSRRVNSWELWVRNDKAISSQPIIAINQN